MTFFKPYSDVLKPYSVIFLQFFFYKCDHLMPGSGSLIVMFLSPIVAFWNSISLKSSSLLFFIYLFIFFIISLIRHNSILIKSSFETGARPYIVWKQGHIPKFFLKNG